MSPWSRSQPPVIPSQLSAQRQSDAFASQQSHQWKDLHGLVWTLHQSTGLETDPAPSQVPQPLWFVELSLQAYPTVEQLLATGTLVAPADARLIGILGDQAVPMMTRPRRIYGASEALAHKEARANLRSYVLILQDPRLHAIKRNLLARFIERSLSFRLSESESTRVQGGQTL